ncbi:MAG: hypothetical protein HY327_00635 [Chloroflexi bacterium]|nr:hypothetical protein [Chloroflexota bacterium]
MPKHLDPKKKKEALPLPLIFGAALLLVVAAIGMWAINNVETGAGQIGPRLAVNVERLDFGKQPFDKMVRAEFKITNVGDRRLTLDAKTPIRVVEGC